MKVTNNNALPFSLLLANGKFEAIKAGESKDMDIAEGKVEEYRSKGFDIKVEDKPKEPAPKPIDPTPGDVDVKNEDKAPAAIPPAAKK